MSTIRDLSALIFGLTKREKSDFEQYADRQGGDQRYMQVYKSLEKILAPIKESTQIPDEEILAKRLRLEVKSGNLAAYCTYLLKMLLRSLRSGIDGNKKEDEITHNIHNARILLRRGLFDAASAALGDAIADAQKYEYFALAIQGMKDLIHLEAQKDSKSYAQNISDKLKKVAEMSDLQQQEAYFFNLNFRAFLLTRTWRSIKQEDAKEELQAIKSDPQLAKPPDKASFFTKVYYWQAKSSVSQLEGLFKEAHESSEQILGLWQSETYQHMQVEYARSYLIHLHNFSNFAIFNSFFEEGEKLLDIMDAFPSPTFDDEAEKFQNALFSRQLLYLNTNRMEAAIHLVEEKRKEIEGVYRSKINTARLISLYYNTLTACFVLKKYPEAQNWSERIYNIGRSEQRRDIQFTNKVFQIIIRFELNEFRFLENEIKNTTQNLRDHGQLDQTNSIILSWLGKLTRNRLDNLLKAAEQKANELQLFLDFRSELLQERENNPNRQIIGLNEILWWLDQKINDI